MRTFVLALAPLFLVTASRPLGAQAAASPASVTPSDSTWAQHNAAANAARRRGDWTAWRHHLTRLDSLIGGHPRVTLSLARAASHLGDTSAALAHLATLAASGLRHDIAADTDFVAVRGAKGWDAISKRFTENAWVIGRTHPGFTLPDTGFLAEDITWDAPRRRFLVSSIRGRRVVAVDEKGRASDVITTTSDPSLLGVLAVRADVPRGVLWVTDQALRHARDLAPADSNRASIARYDLVTGRLQRRWELPREQRPSPGDLDVGPDGAAYVSDSRTGALYVVRAGSDSLTTLVAPGTFASPQGPAVTADGRTVFVADYLLGIAAVDAGTGAVRWLRHARDVALSGIDGLTLAGPRTLLAVQNGTEPNRLLRLTMDESLARIVRAEVLLQDTLRVRQPTHGVLVGRDFHLIENSGWDQFTDAGALRTDVPLAAPRVVRVRLP
jgi:sugar lactone lactonase YvrE